ncbi:MAG TPA: methylenetetrahydrofolate--tRNA-(uracil(54)-C(5))-methyltransferase (FADH(2)-oxidizing) TrmFO, partial [Bdellovibrionota bacterium]|nr:methylenetetrahydrofolate--tRNA-(uracil(54)-C(5))-methyltransferase (FADH(2)-oxidizing) TrmFO [Bdellovibrionota bacterium]
PLTSDALAAELARLIGRETLYFYDSISPIVSADSIDYEKAYFGSRYEPDSEDYLNCPMDRARYEEFVGAIRTGEKVPVRDFEELRCFEGCLPIEVLADRGIKTLAFGPMKPVGLIDPKTGRRPYAVVQLRRENRPTTLYNMVGFQTRLKWGEQKRIFQMIPGLENGEFVRMGSMHRNTFIDSPRLLDPYLRLRSEPRIFVAGQLTGVEGYVESAAMGQWAGLSAVAALRGIPDLVVPPPETAFGALIRAITTAPLHGHFAPMNINFGLLPPPEHSARNKDERRRELLSRARNRWDDWQAVMTERLNGFSRLKAKRNPLSESFDAART